MALATGGFTVRRTTLPSDVILKVNINVIGATKTLKFDGTCTVREAMRLIAHKCLLSVSDEDLETQFVLYKPDGDFDGTYLENHSSYLSANNLQNQDWIEFRRRPTKLVVQNLTGQMESLLVDFDASISSLILFLGKKYSYKEPEKLELHLQARPDEALQLGLSLVEQGVEPGACVLLQKKEKQTKMSIFRKGRTSNYPGSGPGGVVRPWQPPGDKSSGPRPLIFGGTLEDTLAGRDLPVLMIKCITYVKERGIDKEGIFRLSGSAVAIEGFKRAFNEGQDVDLNNCLDIHVVCGLLKQFLRELREPLLTFDLYDIFLETGCQLEAVKSVLSRLPEVNVRVLKYLLGFLSEVASHSATNKMPMHNLATVFAPNLLRMREENIFRIVQDTPAANALTSFLIQNYHSLFPESAGNGATPAATTGARFAVPATATAATTTSAAAATDDDPVDYVSYVRVAYAYEPQDSSELTLSPADVLGVLQDHQSGWWKGEVLDATTLAPSGTIGIFPVTYCDPYEPPATTPRAKPSQPQPQPTVEQTPAVQPTVAVVASAAVKPQPSPRPPRSGSPLISSMPASVGSGSAVSPRAANGNSSAAALTSGGSAITPSTGVKRPTTPTGGGSFILPPARQQHTTASSGGAATTTSRAGLAPTGGRGKFLTMRAPPPLTPAEAQAREGAAGGWENAASPRSPAGSPGSQTRGPASASASGAAAAAAARPLVPPKELKPRLISTYVPAGGRRPSDASSLGGIDASKTPVVVDWEKEACRLRELLEKEQQARSDLERRVQELEQQLQAKSH